MRHRPSHQVFNTGAFCESPSVRPEAIQDEVAFFFIELDDASAGACHHDPLGSGCGPSGIVLIYHESTMKLSVLNAFIIDVV